MRRSVARSAYLAGQFPHGIAKRADLLALGVASSTITRRCRPGGPWRTVLLGLVLLRSGQPTVGERMYATRLHAGEPAMYTGLTGAGLHGVRALPPDPRVHMLIPAARHATSRDFALMTRTTRMPEPSWINGRPVAPLARCLVDAATRMDDVDVVRALMADAVQRRLCTADQLRDELAEPRRPGTALARRVFSEIDVGVRSAAEAWARELVQRSGLPDPVWNVELRTPEGAFIGVVDAYWEEVGLALEVQSRFHLTPTAQARDTQKAADLAAAGVRLVPIMGRDARRRDTNAARQLRDAYEHAAAAPAPTVIASPYRPA